MTETMEQRAERLLRQYRNYVEALESEIQRQGGTGRREQVEAMCERLAQITTCEIILGIRN